MGVSSFLRWRQFLAWTAKHFLLWIIAPATSKFQQDNLCTPKKSLLPTLLRKSLCFLHWFSQGLITLAYPAMEYHPLRSRRERYASQWASEFLDLPSSLLEEEAKRYIDHSQATSSFMALKKSSSFHPPTQPRFSVLICFHQHLDYLKKALRSIEEASAYHPQSSLEILLINDDPSMSSRAIMNEIFISLRSKVRFYTHEVNRGICTSINEALGYAQGEWILHLDCDDCLLPPVFSILEKKIQEAPTKRYMSSRAIDIDEKGNILSWRLRSESPRDLVHHNVASHLKVIRKDLHNDLGLFNPKFEGCQDYEFALRVAIHEPLHFIDDYLYQYRWHDRSQTVGHNQRQNFIANRVSQTYLLVLFWLNHGFSNIQWYMRGSSALDWQTYFSKLGSYSSKNSYRVNLEINRPYEESQGKLLLVQLATIMIDHYRERKEERTLSITL